jgi:hypothetical protein
MIPRYIFKKRKPKYKKILFFLFFLFISITLIYFYIINNNDTFIIIHENNENFYIIPKDRGGEKVVNLDKKSLNLKSKEIHNIKIIKPENLLFSIQFYSNDKLDNVKNYLENITKNDENIYKLEDFYILALNSDIGINYYLIYKNFEFREEAENYCINFLSKIDNCLILDTTKF